MADKDWVNYWRTSAERDFETVEILFKSKKYDHCLFFCHLVIEKLLKGLVYKKINDTPPFIHDLYKLAKIAEIPISKNMDKDLQEITTWNIRARYENIKFQFYKKATKEFAALWLHKVKEIIKWLKSLY